MTEIKLNWKHWTLFTILGGLAWYFVIIIGPSILLSTELNKIIWTKMFMGLI